MGATTKQHGVTPQTTDKLRGSLVDYLMAPQQGGGPVKLPGSNMMSSMGRNPANPNGGALGGLQRTSPYDRMNAGQGYQPSQVNVGVADNVNDQFNAGQQINRGMTRDVGTTFGSGIDSFQRGQIRDVASQGTQSVDQLGGMNSDFFKNMMGQLSPAFQQNRDLALAQAKEASGNLTGSGFANALGQATNRSLADQQAQLANYASQGVGMEMNRQQADAGRGLQAGMANQGMDANFLNQLLQQGSQNLQGQEMGLRGQMANQGADQNFMQNLLTQNTQGLDAQRLGLQAQLANQGNQQAAYGQQATIDAARQNQMAGLDAQRLGQNAQNYTNLLGQQAGAGVGPNEITQSGGIGELLGPLLGGIGGAIGNNPGGISGLLGQIFGGGGQPQGTMSPNTGGWGQGNSFAGQQQAGGGGDVLGQIMSRGGQMAGGKVLGGMLGSMIPIPGVGTAIGSWLGGKAAKPIGKIVGKVGGFLKKIF